MQQRGQRESIGPVIEGGPHTGAEGSQSAWSPGEERKDAGRGAREEGTRPGLLLH